MLVLKSNAGKSERGHVTHAKHEVCEICVVRRLVVERNAEKRVLEHLLTVTVEEGGAASLNTMRKVKSRLMDANHARDPVHFLIPETLRQTEDEN